MMTPRTTRLMRSACIVAGAAMLAVGCGGGEEAVAPPADGAAPAPAGTDPNAAAPGSTVAGGGTTPGATPGAVDPVTGQPVATTAAPTATVPDLVGDDTSSSSFGISSGSALFDPRALSTIEEEETAEVPAGGPALTETAGGIVAEAGPTTTEPVAPSYSGAKIYVDGMVHSVQRNGTFPKGNPMFRLTRVSGPSIELELVAGEFTAGGANGAVLDRGQVVSLLNASEQVTYRLKYLSPIAAGGGAAVAGMNGAS